MVLVEAAARGQVSGGYYTVREAVRLLKINSESRIRGWLRGYSDRAGPVIARQYEPRQGFEEIGFYDLMEIRFVDYFRRQQISLQSIRKAANAARREFGSQHPFALSNAKFVTDRKRIFHMTATETNDARLRDIVTGQYAMYDVIEKFLAKGVEFHPSSNMAASWRPEPENYPNVVLDPKLAHGQPVLDKYSIPTSSLFELWRAEHQNYDAVSDWYEVPVDSVKQAIEYELDLAA